MLSIFIPITLAWVLVWTTPFLSKHTFQFPDTTQLRRADYKVVFSGIYSEEVFRQNRDAFWVALTRTARRQGRFLPWYFVLVLLEGWAIGKLSVSYPSLQSRGWYRSMAEKILLPNISVWHVLLTPFFFADRENTVVWADILCSDKTLYRGIVSTHAPDKDGQLMGVILTQARRFRTDDYLKDKAEKPDSIRTADYWREIPGTKFYVVGSKILNVNLSYQTPSPTPEKMAEMISLRLGRPIKLTIQPKTSDGTVSPASEEAE